MPPPGISIFDKGNGELVVTEELMKRISLRTWRKLKGARLFVLDCPRDGLGVLQA